MTEEEFRKYQLANSVSFLVEIKNARTGEVLKSVPISVWKAKQQEVIDTVTKAVENLYE